MLDGCERLSVCRNKESRAENSGREGASLPSLLIRRRLSVAFLQLYKFCDAIVDLIAKRSFRDRTPFVRGVFHRFAPDMVVAQHDVGLKQLVLARLFDKSRYGPMKTRRKKP